MSDLEYIVHTMQAMSESEDETERRLAERYHEKPVPSLPSL